MSASLGCTEVRPYDLANKVHPDDAGFDYQAFVMNCIADAGVDGGPYAPPTSIEDQQTCQIKPFTPGCIAAVLFRCINAQQSIIRECLADAGVNGDPYRFMPDSATQYFECALTDPFATGCPAQVVLGCVQYTPH